MELPKIIIGRDSRNDTTRNMFSRVVENLHEYLDGPDCGEGGVGHLLDEDLSHGVAELASEKRIGGDAFPS